MFSPALHCPLSPLLPELRYPSHLAALPCMNPRRLQAEKTVDPVSGRAILDGCLELDFTLPAPLPLLWQRIYCSRNPDAGWLGTG